MGQLVFFSALLYVIGCGTAEILAEGLFAPRTPRDAATCRLELSNLDRKRAVARFDAAAAVPSGENASLAAYRSALDTPIGQGGIDWDRRVFALVDGCPATESKGAHALARLRALDEVTVRLSAQRIAPDTDEARKILDQTIAPSTP